MIGVLAESLPPGKYVTELWGYKVGEYIKAGCTCPVLYPLGADVGRMIDAFRGWDA